MKGWTILVTGAAGFVGGYVLNALRGQAQRVLGLVRQESQSSKVTDSDAQVVLGDVSDAKLLTELMQGVDAVVHLAAVNRNHGSATMEAINYRGTINVLGAAKAAGVQRMVQVIGIGADSRRTAPLSRTQGMAAEAVLGSGIPATVLEAAVIYGPGDAFVTTLTGLARVSPVAVIPGDGRARFEPISAYDVADAVVNALKRPETAGRRYLIGGPQVLTLDEIYQLLFETLEIKRINLHLSTKLLRPLVNLMDKLLPEPPITTSLMDLLEFDILTRENATEALLGRPPRVLAENLDFARHITAGQFLSTTFGRRDRRGFAIAGEAAEG